jgi:hypothetical protein
MRALGRNTVERQEVDAISAKDPLRSRSPTSCANEDLATYIRRRLKVFSELEMCVLADGDFA